MCWFGPNSQAMLADFDPGLASRQFLERGRQLPLVQWKLSGAWALAVGMLAGAGLLGFHQVNEFIYFQF